MCLITMIAKEKYEEIYDVENFKDIEESQKTICKVLYNRRL